MEAKPGESIVVAVRVRPLNEKELALGERSCVGIANNSVNLLRENQPDASQQNYEKVFGPTSNNEDVYDTVAKSIVQQVLHGINGTIFAYGQTSCGKTHTMIGGGNNKGVLQLAADEIFKLIAATHGRQFLLRVSFIEIYNETLRDLLADSDSTVAIREDPRKGVYLECSEALISDQEEMLKVLRKGISKRSVEATNMNDTSSRSHTIFRITVESKALSDVEGADDGVLVGTLNLVDLAGSESVKHTGATGQRAKEGGNINKSLLSLSRVIVALSQGQAHVSFRDSKLTRILQPSLSGNAKMAIICCITPAERYIEETRSTLQFASRAKLVSTNATVNEYLDDSSKLKRLERRVNELCKENESIKAQNERLRNVLFANGSQNPSRLSTGDDAIVFQSNKSDGTSKSRKKRETWCPGIMARAASLGLEMDVQSCRGGASSVESGSMDLSVDSSELSNASTVPESETLASHEDAEVDGEGVEATCDIRDYAANLEAEVQRKTDHINELLAEKDDIFKQLEIEMGANSERVEDLHEQIASLKEDNEILREGLASQSQLSQLSQQLQGENNELKVAVEQLKAELEAQSLKHASQMEEMSAQLQAATQQFVESQTSSEVNDGVELEAAKNHIALLEDDLKVSSEFTDTLLQQVEELKAAKSELENLLANAESELVKMNIEATATAEEPTPMTEEEEAEPTVTTNGDMMQLIMVIKELESKVEASAAEIVRLESNVEELTTKQTTASAMHEEELAALTGAVDQLKNEKTQLLSQLAAEELALQDKDQAHAESIKDLESKVEASSEEIARLEAIVQELTTSQTTASAMHEEELAVLTGAVDHLKNEKTQLLSQLAAGEFALQDKDQAHAESIKDLESKVEASSEEIARLEAIVEELTTSQTTASERHEAELSALMVEFEGKSSELMAKHTQELELQQLELERIAEESTIALKSIHAEAITHLEEEKNNEVKALKGETEAIQTQLQSQLEATEAVSHQLTEAKSVIEEQATAIASLHHQVDQHLQQPTVMGLSQVDIDNVKKEAEKAVQHATTELGKKEAEISRLMATIKDLSERAEVAEQVVRSFHTTQNATADTEDNMRKKIGQLTTTVDLLKGERDTLQAKVVSVEKELKQALHVKEVAVDKMQAQLQSLESKLAEKENVSAESTAMKSAIQALEARLQTTRLERDELETNLNNACAKIEELEAEVEALTQSAVNQGQTADLEAALTASKQAQKVACERVADVESQLIESQMRLKKTKDEVVLLQQELSHKDDQLQATAAERDELISEVEKSTQQVAELTEALIEADSVNNANSNSDNNVEELKQELIQTLESLETMTEKAAEAGLETDALKEELATKEREIERLSSAVVELEEKVAANNEISAAEDKNATVELANAQISELNEVIAAKDSEIEQLQASIANLQEEMARISEESKASLLEELNAMMEVKLELESRLEASKSELLELKEEMEVKESTFADQQETFMKAAELEMDSLRSRGKELMAKYQELSAEYKTSQLRESEANETIESLKQEVSDKEDIIASIENEMFSLKQEMQSAAAGGNDSSAELEEAQQQVQKLQEENETLRNAVKQLKKDLNVANESTKQAQSSLEAYRAEMTEVIDVKDKRIAHLDKHKITQQHIEMISKLKEDKKKAQEDNKILKKQLVDLKAAFETLKGSQESAKMSTRSKAGASSASSSAVDSVELSELRAQLESSQGTVNSLKMKMKECAKQLQEYETERTSIIDVLVDQGIEVASPDESGLLNPDCSELESNDLAAAVQKLADKYIKAKSQSVSSSKASASSTTAASAAQLAKLRETEEKLENALTEVEGLKVQRASLEKRVETLKAAAKTTRAEMNELETALQESKSLGEQLSAQLEQSRASIRSLEQKFQSQVENAKSETSPEVMALEEENLELIQENKQLRKDMTTFKLQAERAQVQLAKVSAVPPKSPAPNGSGVVDEATRAAKKRSFGTELTSSSNGAVNNNDNIVRDNSFSPLTKSKKLADVESTTKVAKLVADTTSSTSDPSSAVENTKPRSRPKAVMGKLTTTPSATTAPATVGGDNAPEEGCAQS